MPAAALDRAFTALAHPTRRAIVKRLAAGEASVNEIAKPFAVSLPAISRHLKVLETAGLIAQKREGQFRHYRIDGEGLKTAAEWLDFYRHFWSESFDRLEEHLQATAARKGKAHGKHRHPSRKR